MVRALSGRQWLRSYRGRVVSQDAQGNLTVQMVNAPLGTPDLQTKPMWVGCQGDSAMVQLSSECDVHFQEGDPALPTVTSWAHGSFPVTRKVDASSQVNVGPSSASVQLAGGGAFVGRIGDKVQVAFTVADGALIIAPAGTAGGPCTTLGFTLTGTIIIGGSSKVQSG